MVSAEETIDLELSAESLKVARKLQEEHTEGAERKALVQSYLDTLLPEDWETLDIGSGAIIYGIRCK